MNNVLVVSQGQTQDIRQDIDVLKSCMFLEYAN